MTTLFHMPLPRILSRRDGQPPPRPGLRQRRAIATLRRVLIPLLAGLAVFFALHSVASAAATQEVLVAARSLRQGTHIRPADVEMRTVPSAAAWQSAARSPSEVNGRIAQIDIKPGQPLLDTMIRGSPVVPKGFTVVEARLAGASLGMRLGDEVSLAASTGCPVQQAAETDGHAQADGAQTGGNAQADSNAQGNGNAAGRDDGTCVIVVTAIVMGEAQRDDAGVGAGVSVPLALPPRDAVTMLSVQERGAIMAVAK
ncbi:MAG: SAF domain-containing protein [Bifidobacterium tibiigranuli]|uniref:SAF domain-containing protein n=1 Tax=Bifidobacterium tibiigranuli TaxID=2172043 RepID=UPI00235369D2|nr:SAF domain-containing protein [Bifidobacterium tibiigranuli]MCH4203481.1 SAF domain-containing protein [Bifidobacterium tibiigranuli]MCH4273907.1 SAF domain-containing protein [Bifidobacterium tibiigranuli]MCI1791147.1 SAF domain-containing protein [Bifidobacterium tibiigranuli]MCI1798324.1 SAF domain-containing protein [Bifidobacterium tibiigranuli]